jgi:hypothetical protein
LESELPAPLDERVLERIVSETRGNPLALLELPRGLTPAQLVGGFGLPAAAPLSASTEESFARRLAKLLHHARRLLLPSVYKANKALGPRFITKYGTKQGVLVLSKQIPLGIGIGVGAAANHLIGRAIVGTAKKVFGPAPEFFEHRPDSVVVDAEEVQVAGAKKFEVSATAAPDNWRPQTPSRLRAQVRRRTRSR